MSLFNKLQAGYKLGSNPAITSGLEDWLYVWNKGDFNIIYDPNNPQVVIGMVPVNGAKVWKFSGTNNSFSASAKLAKTAVGPRWVEEIDWNLANNDSTTKTNISAIGYGRVQAAVVNNYKSGDSVIELFGAINGMIINDAERNGSDETLEGGWKLKLGPPDKLREPYAPRGIFIPASPVGVVASVPSVSTARVGTQIPAGVNAVGSTTGGTLAATTYFYKVVSVDAQGLTIGSTEVSATTTGTTSSVTISWTAAPGAVSYRVYKGTVTNTENTYFTTTSLNYVDTGAAGTAGTVPVSSTAIPTTVAPGGVTATAAAGGGLVAQAWFYKVTSVDAFGETIGSSEATATTSGSNLSVTVAWSAAVGAVSYNVYRGSGAGLESVYFTTTALSFLDTGITLPATYQNTLAIIEGFVGNP